MAELKQTQDTSTQGYSYTLLRDQEEHNQPLLQPSAPIQPTYYQQDFTVQPQPAPRTGVHYHTRPYPAPRVVLTAPQQPRVVTQQKVTRSADPSIRLPKYAFVTSVAVTVVFTALCWLPGFVCLVPAVILSMVAISKKEGNRLKEAKQFSILSLILTLIFAVTYPILVALLIFASVYGYICDYQPKVPHPRGSSYVRPYSCG